MSEKLHTKIISLRKVDKIVTWRKTLLITEQRKKGLSIVNLDQKKIALANRKTLAGYICQKSKTTPYFTNPPKTSFPSPDYRPRSPSPLFRPEAPAAAPTPPHRNDPVPPQTHPRSSPTLFLLVSARSGRDAPGVYLRHWKES